MYVSLTLDVDSVSLSDLSLELKESKGRNTPFQEPASLRQRQRLGAFTPHHANKHHFCKLTAVKVSCECKTEAHHNNHHACAKNQGESRLQTNSQRLELLYSLYSVLASILAAQKAC